MTIRRAAVIGAGTMGSGIAGHLANAGVEVVLLDVAGPEPDRSAPARSALERMRSQVPPPFMHPDRAARITTGNIKDHLHRVSDCDWIVEAIVERIEVKRGLYDALDAIRRPGSIVSSNTSTLPLALLTERMSPAMRGDFCITHFFNPVRFMRLLELVRGPGTRPEAIETLAEFSDRALGKGVVHCRDTPGFLANRVGVHALQAGLVEAVAQGVTVEEADAVMGRPMGIPKTGLFGLYDLIGLDLMLDVAASLAMALPPGDPFQRVADGIPLVRALVSAGCTGDKGAGGFYRGAPDAREVVDLQSGAYRPLRRASVEAAQAGGRDGLRALVEHPSLAGRFARRVLARALGYAASLVPDVSDEVVPIDEAMKLGYGWSHGPFEMIDALGAGRFRDLLEAEALPVPPVLDALGDSAFHRVDDGCAVHFVMGFGHRPLVRPSGVLRVADFRALATPMLSSPAASLWDIGDGVACLEFHTKANALGPESMALMRRSLDKVAERHVALVIHSDAPHFSVGFNLEFVRACIAEQGWRRLDAALVEFQHTCRAARQAPFPVVSAPGGMALGGGFEVLLGSDLVQAHANVVVGLVEPLVGLVPSGGGCKEMLQRWTCGAPDEAARTAGALRVFEMIGMSRTATSPELARPLRLLRAEDRTTMNRDRLLADAKASALECADRYESPVPPAIRAGGAPAYDAMCTMLDDLAGKGIALPHDVVVSRCLARVLAGGDSGTGEVVGDEALFALEREAFLTLARIPATAARIAHMLDRGHPLRN
ncbi:MAG: 3-hydroxyacyl-CoA dehydrogenase NAD-binding domain-containing protein [Thiotrichales bacterium]|nr:3-hydroxyacyl-CoA dehydrogenase NAD-binding domain-containing protein [Thiotrichales bacterium]